MSLRNLRRPVILSIRLCLETQDRAQGAELWEVRDRLVDMEYPERPADENEARMVRRLVQLAGVLPTDHEMRRILDAHGCRGFDILIWPHLGPFR